tara:strand:- start:3553 stop:3756 length:204 start_codon:yes stop_codon:yes gene_type:complete
MSLKETIENYKNASNIDLFKSLNFLKERFESDKARVIEITYQIDAVESDYNKLYEEYKKRVGSDGDK